MDTGSSHGHKDTRGESLWGIRAWKCKAVEGKSKLSLSVCLCLSPQSVYSFHQDLLSACYVSGIMWGGTTTEVNRTDKVCFISLCRPSLSDPLMKALEALWFRPHHKLTHLSILSSKKKPNTPHGSLLMDGISRPPQSSGTEQWLWLRGGVAWDDLSSQLSGKNKANCVKTGCWQGRCDCRRKGWSSLLQRLAKIKGWWRFP